MPWMNEYQPLPVLPNIRETDVTGLPAFTPAPSDLDAFIANLTNSGGGSGQALPMPSVSRSPAAAPAAGGGIDWGHTSGNVLLQLGNLLGTIGEIRSGGRIKNPMAGVMERREERRENQAFRERVLGQGDERLSLQRQRVDFDKFKGTWSIAKDLDVSPEQAKKYGPQFAALAGDESLGPVFTEILSNREFRDAVESLYPQLVARLGREKVYQLSKRPEFRTRLVEMNKEYQKQTAKSEIQEAIDDGTIVPGVTTQAQIENLVPGAANLDSETFAGFGITSSKTKQIEQETKAKQKPEQPFSKIEPKDYTAASVREFKRTGDHTVLRRAPTPEKKLTAGEKQRILAQKRGEARRIVEAPFRGSLGQLDLRSLGKDSEERNRRFRNMINETLRELLEEAGYTLEELTGEQGAGSPSSFNNPRTADDYLEQLGGGGSEY